MELGALAQALGAELVGPGGAEAANQGEGQGALRALEITGVAGLEAATPSEVTFLANPRYSPNVEKTKAAAILMDPGAAPVAIASLRVRNPYFAFARALELFAAKPSYPAGVHPTAVVAPDARLGAGVHVGPFAVVGESAEVGAHTVLLAHVVVYPGAQIGSQCLLHAHSVVREGCLLGDRVVLQNGVVVGADGFGFAKDDEGRWYKIPQTGPVVVEDDVEIQAQSCVDRASVGETRVRRGAKIDNLVQVGHGSTVGEGTLLCAQVGLAGSTVLGRGVILAGQVGVAGHCTVGDGAIATAQSGIPNDVPAGTVVSGYPAMPNRQWLRASAAFARLPELLRRLPRERKGS
jgi:UDP-3-O-[3-hydroxymyristoyl] glucosamine N-acyltransferase